MEPIELTSNTINKCDRYITKKNGLFTKSSDKYNNWEIQNFINKNGCEKIGLYLIPVKCLIICGTMKRDPQKKRKKYYMSEDCTRTCKQMIKKKIRKRKTNIIASNYGRSKRNLYSTQHLTTQHKVNNTGNEL